MQRCLLIILLCFTSANIAYSQEEKWTHYGLRPLAMGNAFVSVADDFNALFYNPAGLARLKSWDGEFLNPYLEISQATTTFISDIQELQEGSSGDTEAILDLLEKQTGKVQHFAFGLTPHLIFPNFGFGLGIDLSTTMVFHRYPTIDLQAGPRMVLPIVYAFNLLDDKLSVGFGVKAHFRGGIDREFSIQDIEAFQTKKDAEEDESVEDDAKLEDFIEGGRAFGADFGLLFTPIKPMKPTVGISIINVGSAKFEKMNVSGEALSAPKTILPAFNMGFSFRPYDAGWSYFLVAVDTHAINQPYSFSKKLNLGTELGMGSIFKIQTGLHQGYLSGGFEFDVGLLNFRAITYAEEMGPSAGKLADRRFAIQLKVLF